MSQYFTLLQLPDVFDIDTSLLEQNYRLIAARFHPDKFASASSFEQKQAVMMTAAVNNAYRILKNPIDRAAYLLEQQNIHADNPEHTTFPPEFLMQQMEWRESLAEAQMAQDKSALSDLAQSVRAQQALLHQSLSASFARSDYETAAQQVRQGRFLNKLIDEIEHIL